MGFLISAGFGFLGAAITNYLLRNNLGALRIGAAVCAGIVVGAIVNTVIVSALYRMVPDAAQEDYSLFAIIGTIGGPVCRAIAAWRWRPKSRAVGDLRG